MAKREIKASKQTEIKSPDPLKGVEREFGEANEYIIDQMAKFFRNQVLLELNKSTIEKFRTTDSAPDFAGSFPVTVSEPYTVDRVVTRFTDSKGTEYDEDEVRWMSEYDDPKIDDIQASKETVKETRRKRRTEFRDMMASQYIAAHGIRDAQTGNFAKIYLGLAEKAKRKLLRRFSNDRLSKLSQKYTGKVNSRNADVFYNRVEKEIGISKKQLEATEGLTFQINAYQAETTQWIEKLRDETLQTWTANTLRDMAEGKGLDEILSQFDGMVEKRKGHAKMVARTQISTFNSLVTKARAQNLGIKKAVWVTAQAERVRPCHRVRNGKEFDLADGLYASCDGKTLLPGADYNCFPGSVKINHTSACQVLYRRWYTGELTEIVSDDGVVLRSTANHPILTVDGFKPASLINEGDYIVRAVDESVDAIELNGDDMIPTFDEVFAAIDLLGVKHGVAASTLGKFHGDVSDSDIDVVRIDSLLVGEVNSSIREKFAKLDLSGPDKMIVLKFLTCLGVSDFRFNRFGVSSDSVMRVLNLVRSRLLIHFTPLELFGFALGAWSNAGVEKSLSNDVASNAVMFSDSVFALSVLVHGLNAIDRKIDSFGASIAGRNSNSALLKMLGQDGRMNSNLTSGGSKGHAVSYKLRRAVNNRSVGFSGHVYNLQTISGDYIADTTAVSNCRCTYRLVIPEE